MFIVQKPTPFFRINLGHIALLAALSVVETGCFGAYAAAFSPPNYEAAMAQSQNAVDEQMVQAVVDARTKAEAAPGEAEPALRWAGTLEAAYDTKTVERGKIDGEKETAAVGAALDAAADKNAEKKPNLWAAKGRVLLRAGKQDEGMASLNASMKEKPNLSALIPLIEVHDRQGAHAEVPPLCKKTRPNAAGDDERYLLLNKCLKHGGKPTSIDEGLAWAGPADIAFYKEEERKADERAQARARERQERADQMMAESRARQEEERARENTQTASSSSSGFVSTTVEVRSECSKTVPVFYGEKPKYGSGTRSSVSANSISSAGRKADGTLTIWIIDNSENGIASARVNKDTKRVIIDRSCTSIRAE